MNIISSMHYHFDHGLSNITLETHEVINHILVLSGKSSTNQTPELHPHMLPVQGSVDEDRSGNTSVTSLATQCNLLVHLINMTFKNITELR